MQQLIKDELDLDGKPNLNLASFVNTFMETRADSLMMENISKNLVGADSHFQNVKLTRMRPILTSTPLSWPSTLAAFR